MACCSFSTKALSKPLLPTKAIPSKYRRLCMRQGLTARFRMLLYYPILRTRDFERDSKTHETSSNGSIMIFRVIGPFCREFTGHLDDLNRIRNYGINQLKCASARGKFIFKNAVRVAPRTHFWNTITPFLSDKLSQNDNITLRENGHVISDSKQVATVCNDYFANVTKILGSTTLFRHTWAMTKFERQLRSTEAIQVLWQFEIT